MRPFHGLLDDIGNLCTKRTLLLRPLLSGCITRAVLLGIAGANSDGLHRLRRGYAEFVRLCLDVGPAFAECLNGRARNAGNFERSVLACDARFVSQLRQICPQLGVISRPDHRCVLPQFHIVQCPPFTVRALRHIGDCDVTVQLRIKAAAEVMVEACMDKIASRNLLRAAPSRAGESESFLRPVHGVANRVSMRLNDALVAADKCYKGNRFRRAESEIGTHVARPVGSACKHIAIGQDAVHDPRECPCLDGTRKTKRASAFAAPFGGAFVRLCCKL